MARYHFVAIGLFWEMGITFGPTFASEWHADRDEIWNASTICIASSPALLSPQAGGADAAAHQRTAIADGESRCAGAGA